LLQKLKDQMLGDIGYQPEEVERKLESTFTLAHKWGCVLLLDEADVFLAKRNKDDVKRNGLVSGKQVHYMQTMTRH
jgi:hypothetical protein